MESKAFAAVVAAGMAIALLFGTAAATPQADSKPASVEVPPQQAASSALLQQADADKPVTTWRHPGAAEEQTEQALADSQQS